MKKTILAGIFVSSIVTNAHANDNIPQIVDLPDDCEKITTAIGNRTYDIIMCLSNNLPDEKFIEEGRFESISFGKFTQMLAPAIEEQHGKLFSGEAHFYKDIVPGFTGEGEFGKQSYAEGELYHSFNEGVYGVKDSQGAECYSSRSIFAEGRRMIVCEEPYLQESLGLEAHNLCIPMNDLRELTLDGKMLPLHQEIIPMENQQLCIGQPSQEI